MLLRQLQQYSLFELIRISIFKVGYRLTLSIEKIKVKRGWIKYDFSHTTLKYNLNNVKTIKPFLLTPQKFDQAIIDNIEAGRITLFSQSFNIESWLKDPISKKIWPRDEFFINARTRRDGYGDVKYVLELNKLNHLVIIAVAYYYDGNEKHIRYIEKQLKNWIEEIKYEYSVVYRIIMDSAFRSINLIFISIFCFKSEYFKSNVYPLIHQILLLHERQIRKFNTPRWFKTGNGANHVIGEMVGLIILKIWISICCNIKTSISEEYNWLYKTLEKLISPTGVYLEHSANYSRVVGEFLVLLDMFEPYIQTCHIKEDKYIKNILTYITSLSHHNLLPNFGDNDAASILIPYKKSFDDIRPLYTYAHRCNYIQQNLFNLANFAQSGEFVWKSFDELDIYVFIRCGIYSIFRQGASAHIHNDILSLILTYGKEQIFIDKGCYYYNQSTSIREEYIKTSSHNTVFVPGYEQADYIYGGWYNYPQSNIFTKNRPNCIFEGAITYKDIKHSRIIFYCENKIIIHDNVIKPQHTPKASYHYLLHENIHPTINETNTITLSFCNKQLAKIYVHGASLEIINEEYYPNYANIVSTKALTGQLHSSEIITVIEFYK